MQIFKERGEEEERGFVAEARDGGGNWGGKDGGDTGMVHLSAFFVLSSFWGAVCLRVFGDLCLWVLAFCFLLCRRSV